MNPLIERETARETLYQGKILSLEKMTVVLPNGQNALREIVRHHGAAAIIPINEKGEVAMVKQYRAAVGKILYEIPAGKFEKRHGSLLECAKCELKEETGLCAGNIRQIAGFYTTPGFCDEFIAVFLATDLTQGARSLDEDEFLAVEWFGLDDLTQMALKGEICDSKTLVAILLAKQVWQGKST